MRGNFPSRSLSSVFKSWPSFIGMRRRATLKSCYLINSQNKGGKDFCRSGAVRKKEFNHRTPCRSRKETKAKNNSK